MLAINIPDSDIDAMCENRVTRGDHQAILHLKSTTPSISTTA